MWATLGILTTTAIIIALEVPSMKKNKNTKGLFFFSFFLIIGTVLSLAESSGVNIPNPLDFLRFMYEPMHTTIQKLFS
ncbi:hypothetical protein LC040_14910 [Bacillus tianshenii]|nr:hypothetical protein LC040_14910 [Bacillus tianshenii]